jgi:Cdc6-like AAA superfamily ATPase
MADQTTLKPNPFPENPVATDTIEKLHDFRGTKCYFEVEKRLEIYREEFFRKPTGLALGISGAFGSGKTHLVLQLLDHLQEAGTPPFKLIRTTAEHADFKQIYVENFAKKIEANDLKSVIAEHYRKLVRGKVSDEGSSDGPKTFTKMAQEEVDRLADSKNAQGILQLVNHDMLPIKGLPAELDAEIAEMKKTSKELAADFFVVYSKVTDPDVGPLALRWLQGDSLSEGDRSSLGLESRGIKNADYAKNALKFLLGAFKKAGYGVVFCIDEFERFALRGTPADKKAASGLLKDLAEIFKNSGHILIVSGISDAWNKLPPDVFHRIKRPDITDVRLSPEEAKGILKAYAQADVEQLFSQEALALLFSASELNARRLLTISYYAYQTWEGDDFERTSLISEPHIKRATDKVLSDTRRIDSAAGEIQAAADALALPCQRDFNLSGFEFNFLLGKLDNQPVVVTVTKSIFKLGEVQSARAITASSQALKRDYPEARFCVVIIGYSTPEVRNGLAEVVDRVFYYDEEKFASEFREFLSSPVRPRADAQATPPTPDRVYRDLDERFDQLEKSRNKELEQIRSELERMRAESAREVEVEREKRVRDKMAVPLADLKSLIRKEEALAIRGKSSNGSWGGIDGKVDEALHLIDKQRSAIKEAEILNERLSYEREFSRRLRVLATLTDTTEVIWSRALRLALSAPTARGDFFLDDYYERTPLRQLYREKADVQSALDVLHTRRTSEANFGPLGQMWLYVRRVSWPILSLIVLSVLGVAVFVYAMSNAWWTEASNRDGHISTLLEIKNVARRISLNRSLESTTLGQELGQSLIKEVSNLDKYPADSAQRFDIANQLDDITRLATLINEDIGRGPSITAKESDGASASPSPTPRVFPERFHGQELGDYNEAADLLIYNCDSATSRLSNFSFVLLLKYFALQLLHNPLYLVLLLPLLYLLLLFRSRRRREARWKERFTPAAIKLRDDVARLT